MEACDGAELCELVGSFLLHQLSNKYNEKSIGLYREDGLAVFKNKSGPQVERTCNCTGKSKCLLNNKCLSNDVFYKVNITSTSEDYRNKIYYDISETKFMSRYANHRKSVKNRNYKTDTELSKEIWKLKEQSKNADIQWEILGIYQSFNTSTKRCMLCLNEKLAIAIHKEDTKIISKCRHSIKYILGNYDTKY